MRTKKTLKFYFHFQTSTIHNILKGQHNCVFFCIPCWFLTEGSQVTLFHGTHSTLSIRRLFQTKWRMKVSVYLFIYLFSQIVQVLLLWFFLSIIALCRVIAPVKRWCYKITDVCPSVCHNDIKSRTAHLFLLICFLKRQSFFFYHFRPAISRIPFTSEKVSECWGRQFKEMSNKRKHDSFI